MNTPVSHDVETLEAMTMMDDNPDLFVKTLICDGSSGDLELERQFANVLQAAFETFKVKQASYGPTNISKFGQRGVIVRMNDKLARIINLVWNDKENPLNDESIADTYEDMLNYAAIATLCFNNLWPEHVEHELEVSE